MSDIVKSAFDNMTNSLRNVSAQLLETQQELEATKQGLQDFQQEVSDALVDFFGAHLVAEDGSGKLASFIIPAPKPDPLVEVLAEVDIGNGWDDEEDYARQIHKALDARGLEIRKKNDDQ